MGVLNGVSGIIFGVPLAKKRFYGSNCRLFKGFHPLICKGARDGFVIRVIVVSIDAGMISKIGK